MKTIVMDMQDSDESTDAHIWNVDSMSFWLNNFRAVYQNGPTSGDADTAQSINFNLKGDAKGFEEQDKYASVLIDSIKFLGYNTSIQTASVSNHNNMRELAIPANVFYPPCSGQADGIYLNNEGDNYYLNNNVAGQVNLCFGVDGVLDLAKQGITQNPWRNDDVHYFLMNNFSFCFRISENSLYFILIFLFLTLIT